MANLMMKLMSRIEPATVGISEKQLGQALRDSMRETVRTLGLVRDVAEFPARSNLDEYVLPAAGKEFARIYDMYGRGQDDEIVQIEYPDEWKGDIKISDDGETGAWAPSHAAMQILQQVPYPLCIEYVMTMKMDENEYPEIMISQLYETVIYRALMNLPRKYLADERMNYERKFEEAMWASQRRAHSGGVFWVRTPPFWGDGTRRTSTSGGNRYGLYG